MKRLTPEEILDVDTYESVRPEYRPRVLAHKNERRVAVGPSVSVMFEDRETVRYQIQEMCRVEQIRDPEKVQLEVSAYNDLVPGESELSATLFIEIPELDRIRPELERLLGIDEHVMLTIGAGEGAHRVTARFDPGQMEEDRISAVHYIRFELDERQAADVASSAPLALHIDHPSYDHRTDLPESTRASLARDLSGSPAGLLDPASVAPVALRRPEVLFESDLVRVTRPARAAPGTRVVIEPRLQLERAEAAGSELLAELMAAVSRYASEMASRGGRSRVRMDLDDPNGPGASAPHRWHVFVARD